MNSLGHGRPPRQQVRITTVRDCVHEFIDHIEVKTQSSPLEDWFLEFHPSTWEIGETMELLRDGPHPGDTVRLLRAIQEGGRDPDDYRDSDLWEVLTDYY